MSAKPPVEYTNAAKACREAFVRMVKAENAFREPYARTSLRAHGTGPNSGFASGFTQRRWHDFKAGWFANGAIPPFDKPILVHRKDLA